MNRFDDQLAAHDRARLTAAQPRILQAHITRRCNMACQHCHVESAPNRSETMTWATMQAIIALVESQHFELVDLTGGAPEIYPQFRRFVSALRATGTAVQVRSNLTIHSLPEHADCLPFLAAQGVAMVASLPCYLEENVDRQRGRSTFSKSLLVLRQMNRLGYGIDADKPLHLVYNPIGPHLPPPQQDLESAYRRELQQRYGIVFTSLYTITNMPIGRFAQDLARQGKLDDYLTTLAEAFNPETVEGLMCRHQVEIDYDGRLYDCDFNLALGLPIADIPIDDCDITRLVGRHIRTGSHCLGCTAGCGSSCGGALVDQRRTAV